MKRANISAFLTMLLIAAFSVSIWGCSLNGQKTPSDSSAAEAAPAADTAGAAEGAVSGAADDDTVQMAEAGGPEEADAGGTVRAAGTVDPADDVAAVILHTNDVHCGFEDNIGYDGLVLYKKELESRYDNVFLVDSGDSIQGAPIGSISKGQEITKFMNYAGYDVATLGNHEFDFGTDVLMDCVEEFDGTYVCADFCTPDGKPILDAYRILDAGDIKIGFIGAVTPEVFAKTTLHDVVNEYGEPMYNFYYDDTRDKLCEALQNSIDEIRAEGADYVILLSHLGNDETVLPQFRMETVLAGLSGLDAVFDGHSHETFNMTLPDKDGKEVIVSQTGTKLASVGQLTIYKDGHIEETLVSEVPEPEDGSISFETVLRGKEERRVDPDTRKFMDDIWAGYAEEMNKKVGELSFDMPVKEGEEQICRLRENALCDLVADAYRTAGQTQITFINSGSVKNDLKAGDITFQSILNILPYSNDVVTASVSGQTLLDALENGAARLPVADGKFLQVSGMTYTIDQTKESTVEYDSDGHFVAVMGGYRVTDVRVGGEPLDLTAEYTVTTSNYLLSGANGYDMLKEADVLLNTMTPDNEIVVNYIRDTLGGVIPDEYREPQGRITIIE